MIDLSKVLERIQTRLDELGVTAAEVSAKATDSKDTIRNWVRAVEADKRNGTVKASATTIKLNQIEEAIGLELVRNVIDARQSAETQLRSALLAYGVDAADLRSALKAIKGFVDDVDDDEQPRSVQHHDQSEPASRRRAKEPSR